MKIIKWKIGDTPPHVEGQLAVAIGNFDGIHQGHVKLLNECKLQAQESNLAFGVVSFDPHPRDFFNPKNPSFKLLDHEEKETLLSKLGVEFLIIIEFNEELKNFNAEEFLSQILKQNFNIVKMFAGSNFKFGKNREGSIENTKNFAKSIGLDVISINLKQTNFIIENENEIISSQKIRMLIQNGKLKLANDLLGRNWYITGTVEKGKQQGREIGFPTANISLKNFLKPPLGVYVSRLKVIINKNSEKCNDWLPSISNIGTRPTVSGDSINLETHIIDFKENNFESNLYGRRIKVELIEFLRPEKKFKSLSELQKQIEVDTKRAYEFHK
tara:strand:- start:19 stop:1002 length:984 start_codon:yes stop_codon:yes gene_type:complete